jgi:rubrerythrin
MTDEIDTAKIKHLLGHWIEHNESHSQSFEEWAEKIKTSGYKELAEEILQANKKMKECSDLLRSASNKI